MHCGTHTALARVLGNRESVKSHEFYFVQKRAIMGSKSEDPI